MHGTTGPSRRSLLAALPLGVGAAALGTPTAATAAGLPPGATGLLPGAGRRFRGLDVAPLSMRGGDVSFLLQSEAAGARYTDLDDVEKPFERVLADNGATWVRLRVWVDPPEGYSDVASALELTRRAHAAGLRVLLDLHYSDWWADPAHQRVPAAWLGQELAALTRTVRRYTRDTLDVFHRAGEPVDMVAVGNEITAGMLWPLGQVYREGEPEDWSGFLQLLRAASDGARASRTAPPVMVHVDRGGDGAGARWFYDHVVGEVPFDVVGLSYYPFWHGPLEDLRANLHDLAGRYGLPLVVAEASYPWTLEDGDDLENLITAPAQLPDGDRFPATPAGQAAYFEALREVVRGVPGGLGWGFLPWEPAWVPGVGWAPGEGNPNDNLTLVDHGGRGLPALRGLRAP